MIKPLIVILALFSLILIAGCNSELVEEKEIILRGEFYDEEGSLLGFCDGYQFYNLEKEQIGGCTYRDGPGSSGDQGNCWGDDVMTLFCNGIEINSVEECNIPTEYGAKYRCIYPEKPQT